MQPDYGRMCPELRRKDMTLMLLREEHRADHANGRTHAYSQCAGASSRICRAG